MNGKVDGPSPDLQDRLRFETMLSDLSSRFVNLEPAEVVDPTTSCCSPSGPPTANSSL